MDIISYAAASDAQATADSKVQYYKSAETDMASLLADIAEGDVVLNTDNGREYMVLDGVYVEKPSTPSAIVGFDGTVADINEAIENIVTFDYVEATNPGVDVTDAAVGQTWINTANGELFICTDATSGANRWVGQKGTVVPEVFGLNWNQTTDSYLRTFSAAYMEAGEDFTVTTSSPQSQMRRCVMNDDGTINYYLDANDSTLQEDGVTAAVLDGTDGNVMVEVPKFYYKYNYNTITGVVHEHAVSLYPIEGGEVHPAFVVGGVEKEYRYYPAYLGYNNGGVLQSRSGVYPTTDQTISTFRTQAEANGTGWHQIDFLLYEAITLLMVIEYGTMNIQATLGEGRTALSGGAWTNGSYIGINGLSNGDGNNSANNTYTGDADDAGADASYMTYRGCENFYGNVWRFADGLLAQSNVPYINQDPTTYTSTSLTGSTSTGVTLTSTDGYARELGNSNKGFFPTSVSGGTSSTGTTDYFYANDAGKLGIALVGGSSNYGLVAGPLYLTLDSVASTSIVNVGAGVSR